MAPSQVEPPMPPGVNAKAMLDWMGATFGDDVAAGWWKWFTVTHRNWGRDGWARVDTARKRCPG